MAFSWIAYDVEQRCATEQACYYIRPEYSQVSDRKLQLMGIDRSIITNGISLAEAVQQFDSVIFSTCQKSRKPMTLASFDVAKFYKFLNMEAAKKDITLYTHYSHLIDIAHLIREMEPSVQEEDLLTVRKAASRMTVNLVGHRDAGLDNCQIVSHILTRMFQKGLQMRKEHSKIISENGYMASSPGGNSGAGASAIVRLRGLPWEIDIMQLLEFLDPVCHVNKDDIHIVIGYDVNAVLSCGYILIETRIQYMYWEISEGRTNGEAYVVLPTMEYRDLAIRDLHGKLIGRRWVEVFKATEEEFKRYLSNKRGATGGCTAVGESVVRLRGLPWSCNEYEIVKFFRGTEYLHLDWIIKFLVLPSFVIDGGFDLTVDEVAMGYGADNRLTGEAWVLLTSPEEAEAARLSLHKKPIGRRYIEVFASSQEEMEQAKHYRTGQASSQPFRNKQLNQYVKASATFGFTVIRLRGLPFHANESHIVNFFSGFQMSAVLPSTAPINGRPSGEAYVQFTDAEEAWKAYHSKNGHLIDRRYIELFPATMQDMEYAMRGGDPRFRERRARPY
ncbi:Rna recognition motif-containing protein [Cardiosporidium cionae]|uniref:Rna recognition motif-containing protein n=1 Tax=Cardiosporidium cionae TaxID=476202 RepID=A0ABQ7J442_9APIC|nr:Rna recognition motif-containing protein [Cardiosporidium cionae]|eukprot:KAF8817873.1 Rna recognition motif-containing protein [Cardiosporidium cionae]